MSSSCNPISAFVAVVNSHIWQQSWLLQRVNLPGLSVDFDFFTRSSYLFAVSYTHLDVYKRQVYVLLVLVGMFLVSLEGLYDLETNFTAALTCISNVGPGLGDVYKRQAGRGLRGGSGAGPQPHRSEL